MKTVFHNGETYNQLVQYLKIEINHVINLISRVHVHRVKFYYIQQKLAEFKKTIANKESQNRDTTFEEREISIQIYSLIISFISHLNSFTESEFQRTLRSQPISQISTRLRSFRNNFNQYSKDLKLTDVDIFDLNEYQECLDEIADLKFLQSFSIDTEVSKDIKSNLDTWNAKLKILDASKYEVHKVLSINDIKKQFTSCKTYEIDSSSLVYLTTQNGTEIYLDKRTNQFMASRKFHLDTFDQHQYDLFEKNITMLKKFSHHAIVPLNGYCLTNSIQIFTQYMNGGNLYDYLHNHSLSLNMTNLTIIALGISQAMELIHGNNMLHRDLRSMNILLDSDYYPHLYRFDNMCKMNENDNDLVGSTRWMAPEVLQSSHYDQKTDVYSYGILLWEMLTSEIPFSDYSETQIADLILKQNKRPTIPHYCPSKLAKLIKICWHKDPNRRPDFKSITLALSSGEIGFPGCDFDQVNTYKNMFSLKGLRPMKFADNKQPSEETLKETIKNLSRNDNNMKEMSMYHLVKNIGVYGKLLCNYPIINIIINVSGESLSNEMAKLLDQFITELFKLDIMKNELLRNDFFCQIQDLFSRYSTTETPLFYNILLEHYSKIGIFNEYSISKFSNFMICNEIDKRIEVTELMISLIKSKSFDSIDSLFPVIDSSLINIGKFDEKLSKLSLDLIYELLIYPKIITYIIKCNGTSMILPICLTKNSEMSELAFNILEKLTTNQRINLSFIKLFINKLEQLFSNINIQHSLNILASLTNNNQLYNELSNSPYKLCNILPICFSKPNQPIIIYSLKVSFMIFSNIKYSDELSELIPLIISLLSNANQSISILAAYNLTILLSKPKNISKYFTVELCSFLSKAIATNTKLSVPSLRLIGTISTKPEGAEFIKNKNLIAPIINLLNSKFETNLIIEILSSISSSANNTDFLVQYIPQVMNYIDVNDCQFYVLSFICNVSKSPKAANVCLPFVQQLLNKLNNKSAQMIFEALSRIFNDKNVMEDEKSDVITKIVNESKNYFDGNAAEAVFKTLDILAQTKSGKNAMNQSFEKLLAYHGSTLSQSNPNKALIESILTRLKNK